MAEQELKNASKRLAKQTEQKLAEREGAGRIEKQIERGADVPADARNPAQSHRNPGEKPLSMDEGPKPVKATKADARNPKPNTLYESNGYYYQTDKDGKLVEVSGDLRLGKAPRNDYQQKKVGKSSGVGGDEGGHMIGAQFDGPGEGPLHMVPQGMKLNRGAGSKWTAMEREWKEALEGGNRVSVNIHVDWPPGSRRPDGFTVDYRITNPSTGETRGFQRTFVNP